MEIFMKNTLKINKIRSLALILALFGYFTPTLPMLGLTSKTPAFLKGITGMLALRQTPEKLGTRDLHINDYQGLETIVKDEFHAPLLSGAIFEQKNLGFSIYADNNLTLKAPATSKLVQELFHVVSGMYPFAEACVVGLLVGYQ